MLQNGNKSTGDSAMTDEIHVYELPSWSAFLFRLTAFLSPTAEFDTTNWWKDVVGEPPDAQISNPKLFQRLEILSYKNGNLLLEIQPGRIDWIYTSLPQN